MVISLAYKCWIDHIRCHSFIGRLYVISTVDEWIVESQADLQLSILLIYNRVEIKLLGYNRHSNFIPSAKFDCSNASPACSYALWAFVTIMRKPNIWSVIPVWSNWKSTRHSWLVWCPNLTYWTEWRITAERRIKKFLKEWRPNAKTERS